MDQPPLRTGHVDHCWELAPGCCVIAGWCTDAGPDACLELVHSQGVQVLPLGDPRVSRPHVCDALGISRALGEALGFFVAASFPAQAQLQEIHLAGQSLALRSEQLHTTSSYRVMQRCLDALNWGYTPLEALHGFLHGSLGTVLGWINQPTSPLHWPATRLEPGPGPALGVRLPACSELVWLQIWRLAQQPKSLSPARLRIELEARACAMGDPEEIAADLLKSWSALGLPEPTISIATTLDRSETAFCPEGRWLGVDGRRWLLPLGPWWQAALQIQSAQDPALPDDALLQLGFTPIDWAALPIPMETADSWAWQLQMDQWLQAR